MTLYNFYIISRISPMEYKEAVQQVQKACTFVKLHQKMCFSPERKTCFGTTGCCSQIDSNLAFPCEICHMTPSCDKSPFTNRSFCSCGNPACNDIVRAMSQLENNCADFFNTQASQTDNTTHRPLVQVRRSSGAIEEWQLWCCDLDGRCFVMSRDVQTQKWIDLEDLLSLNKHICVCFTLLRWDQWATFLKAHPELRRFSSQLIY